jgi:hypothetical protein
MCDNLDVEGKRCAMEWPELKYSGQGHVSQHVTVGLQH